MATPSSEPTSAVILPPAPAAEPPATLAELPNTDSGDSLPPTAPTLEPSAPSLTLETVTLAEVEAEAEPAASLAPAVHQWPAAEPEPEPEHSGKFKVIFGSLTLASQRHVACGEIVELTEDEAAGALTAGTIKRV